MLLWAWWEGRQSSAQRACYLPSLSRYPFIHLGWEEQVRVKYLAQGHNTRALTGFEPTTLGSWVWSSTAELRVLHGYYLTQKARLKAFTRVVHVDNRIRTDYRKKLQSWTKLLQKITPHGKIIPAPPCIPGPHDNVETWHFASRHPSTPNIEGWGGGRIPVCKKF